MVKNLNRDLKGETITNAIGKVGMDQDAAVTPKLMNPSMDQGKQVDQARSMGKKLDVMSSTSLRDASGCLLWFANILLSTWYLDTK
ncbi:hypothetical protein Tco_1250020 [Tanacetum coccineum]